MVSSITGKAPWAPMLLVVMPVASVCAFLALGAGYVLDDWYLLRNAHFDGAWSAAGDETGLARPGSIPVFALLFGVFGQHALLAVLVLLVVNIAAGLLLLRLLLACLPVQPAVLTAVLWMLLPTHLSTEVWITCTIISVSLLLLLAALNMGVEPTSWRRAGVVAVLVAASVLTYEASLPAAGVGAVAVPWLARREHDLRFTLAAWAGGALAALWVVTHWFSGKDIQPWADPSNLFQANFGWGITPTWLGALNPILCAVALLLLARAVARVVLPSLAASEEDLWILGGGVVMLLGFVPFVRYFYSPLGAGDRVNYLSAVGAALVWASLLILVSRRLRVAGPSLLVALVLIALMSRWERLQLWSAAGRDADAIAAAAVRDIPDPSGPVVLGPRPVVRENVAAYLDPSNLQGALALAYGVPRPEVGISHDPQSFESVDPDLRLDAPSLSELDDVDLLFEG